MTSTSATGTDGVDAAVRVARRFALVAEAAEVSPRLLHAGANAVVHLHPAPVVARIAHWTASVRGEPGAHLGLEVALSRRAAAGESLVRLHAGMAGYDGWMPGPENVASDSHRAVMLLARLGLMPTAEAAEIGEQNRAALDEMRSVMARLERDEPGWLVPLHGDPHGGNLLDCDGRATWWDLDDAWRGPVEWDLTVAHRSEQLDGAVAMQTYCDVTGFVPDAEAMAVSRRLRVRSSRFRPASTTPDGLRWPPRRRARTGRGPRAGRRSWP